MLSHYYLRMHYQAIYAIVFACFQTLFRLDCTVLNSANLLFALSIMFLGFINAKTLRFMQFSQFNKGRKTLRTKNTAFYAIFYKLQG